MLRLYAKEKDDTSHSLTCKADFYIAMEPSLESRFVAQSHQYLYYLHSISAALPGHSSACTWAVKALVFLHVTRVLRGHVMCKTLHSTRTSYMKANYKLTARFRLFSCYWRTLFCISPVLVLGSSWTIWTSQGTMNLPILELSGTQANHILTLYFWTRCRGNEFHEGFSPSLVRDPITAASMMFGCFMRILSTATDEIFSPSEMVSINVWC